MLKSAETVDIIYASNRNIIIMFQYTLAGATNGQFSVQNIPRCRLSPAGIWMITHCQPITIVLCELPREGHCKLNLSKSSPHMRDPTTVSARQDGSTDDQLSGHSLPAVSQSRPSHLPESS
jgi:hypothetical protein